MWQYEANVNVFKCCLNVSLPTSESHKYSGKEFHTYWPTTEKARRAVVFCWQRRRTRSHRLADWSCDIDQDELSCM